MSLSEEQKAYHLKKMKATAKRFDTNKDGYMSHEDFELMGKRLIEYGKLSKEQAEHAAQGFMKYAELFQVEPGTMIPLDEIAQRASDALLSLSADKRKAMLDAANNSLFDVIDLNKDGCICMEEFKVHYRIAGADVSDEEVIQSFNTIDTDKDGEISREEFLAASDDFFNGVDKTEVSRVFLGRLED